MLRQFTGKRLLAISLLLVSFGAHAGASCLLFPLSCLKPSKKYGEEQEATVISIDVDRKTASAWAVPNICVGGAGCGSTVANPLDNTREYFVAFQVGMTRYVAWRKDTVVQMMAGYTPKREEWVGKTLTMRFVDSSWFGIKGPGVVFKTPKKGKEWDLVIVDIIGPDGVDECKPYFGLEVNLGHCEPQAKVDRAAREQQILAALKAEGIDKPLWDVQDRKLAERIYSQRSGTASRSAVGYGRTDFTHDKTVSAEVAHPDVGGAPDARSADAAAPAAAPAAPAAESAPPAAAAMDSQPAPAATAVEAK